MSRIYLFIIALFILPGLAIAQTMYTWTGGPVGDYQNAANWSPSRTASATTDILAFNIASPVAVANVPNQTIGAIRILSGTSAVSFATNVTTNVLSLSAATPLIYSTAGSIQAADLLTISLVNSAAFSISSGTFGIAPSTGGKINISSAVTLAGGTLDFDVVGTGGTVINAGGSVTYISGSFNCNTLSALNFTNGSNYYHAVSGAAASAIPVAYWSSGSTCNVTGMNGGTIAPTGFTTVIFSNVTWNCPSQTGNVDIDLAGNPCNISGTLTVTSTGAGSNALRFSSSTISIINAGAYTQTGGALVLQSSTGSTYLTITNLFSHTGGALDFAGSGASSGTAILIVKGDVTKAAGTTWNSSSTNTASQMTIQFSGTVTQYVSINGTWNVPGNGRCNITNTNSDPTGVSITLGSLRITNRNSSVPAICTNSGRFTGAGSMIYSGSGVGNNNYSLIYNGNIPQSASAIEFPAVSGPSNLIINNPTGVSFPSSFSRTIANTLNMSSGNLAIGSGNTLTLSNTTLSVQLAYTGGFITSGTLARYFPTAGLPTDTTTDSRFPFGSGINDRSLYVYFSTATLSGGIANYISVSHNAVVNASAIGPVADNGITLDKRTNSNWTISTALNLGSGGTTIFLKAQATNIGSVDNLATLRLTDAATGYGTLIPTTGTTDAPRVGKSGLLIADISNKTLYVGSDFTNALQIVTFTWTGASSTSWATAANWTGGVGYPSAPTEIAIINTASGNMPVINTGAAINVYQLTVGASASLTMTGTGSISIYDVLSYSGAASFASTSTFTYASSNNPQTVLNLPYGNLAVSGAAIKTMSATVIITGDFNISGTNPTFGTGTVIYDAGTAPLQKIASANYYNLTLAGNRSNRSIRLGNGVTPNTIDIANNFVVTATGYVANDGGYNTLNFSSAGSQNIPGFTYGNFSNSGNGMRIYDPLGSTDPSHVITCRSFTGSSTGGTTVFTLNVTTGSKIVMNRTNTTVTNLGSFPFYDFELTGNFGGSNLSIITNNELRIAGSFNVTATNFKQIYTSSTINFNGTNNQTIPAFKYINASNTPSFKYNNLTITNGGRIITLAGTGTDTIGLYGTLTIPAPASFTPGTNGFVVTGSTVNFITNSGGIPVLPPLSAVGNNYNNIAVTGGVRLIAGDLMIGGNVSVTGTDGNAAQLNIGNNAGTRLITIAGNLSVTGTSASNASTGLIDFNSVDKIVQVKLAGNLSVNGTSQLTTGNEPTLKGTIIFNGINQQYNNTAINKNKFVNFIVGDGISPTILTLNNHLELTRSGSAPFSDTLTVANNATLNVGTKNIKIGIDTLPATNNAVFNLNAGAILITSNTGVAPDFAIEGVAANGSTGTILSGTKITKNYNAAASYVLNGATVNPFPASITTMANLTIGAPVSLNRSIIATSTLDLASYTLTQASNNLQFSGLTSTTGNIYADQSSALSITGTVGTVGALRFALPGGNITGQFTINRPVAIPLASDLIIDNTTLTGNFITGSTSSILDINGNTLTISGAVSGSGTLSGSSTSSLILKGIAGVVSFTPTKQILKNLTLLNTSTATLGTLLDITGGNGPGTEGTVSITGTSLLTTSGNLTLKSGPGGTARVAPGAATGNYITGDVSVERYLTSIRSWRFLAAPSYGQTIKQSWQENQAAGYNPATGYGTNITSNSANWASEGFDFQTPGNSLLVYKPALNGWDGTGLNTGSQISVAGANKSYMLFLRGDRSVTPAVGAPSTSANVRTKGTLFQGDLPAVAVGAGEYAAVGNNYACAIDFTLLTKSNLRQSFSVWDPKMPGAKGLGGWVTFSASTPVPWEPIPSASGASYTPGIANTRIESGQGFIVQSSGPAGSVSLKENSKVSGSKLVSRPVGANSIKQSIKTNLYNTNTGVANIADGNVVVFSADYANAIDEWDALKPGNFGDNFGLSRNGQTLVVDARQPVTDNDTVFFNMKKIKLQSYRLEFIADNFDNTLIGFLEDNFLHTVSALNMTGTTIYDFSVTSAAGASAADRFRIVFRNTAPLPVTFTSVSAIKRTGGTEVSWKAENEAGINNYEIEYSTDGIHFTKMFSIAANNGINYSWLDAHASAKDNFYRIKSISNRNSFEYSRIVKVSANEEKSGFAVYPNPVTGETIGLLVNNLPAGNYMTRLINTSGQVVSKNVIAHNGGTATKTITPDATLVTGNYHLEITGPDNKTSTVKVLVQH